jgi:hypothetical protein
MMMHVNPLRRLRSSAKSALIRTMRRFKMQGRLWRPFTKLSAGLKMALKRREIEFMASNLALD